jgi:hypothetical protein
MALKPEQAQAIIKEVGNRKVNHGKLTHMHGFRGKYTILAHLLDMSLVFLIILHIAEIWLMRNDASDDRQNGFIRR